jgi:hypothetical protein
MPNLACKYWFVGNSEVYMPSPLITATLLALLGQNPSGPGNAPRLYDQNPTTQPAAAAPAQQAPGVTPVPARPQDVYREGVTEGYVGYRLTPNYGEGASYGSSTFGYAYPNYDAYEPWVHGYWQDLPAYGGFAAYRPYNYRHVYIQSEVAGVWGTSTVMPNSQEYFRRPREQGLLEQRTSSVGRRRANPIARQQAPRVQLPTEEKSVRHASGIAPVDSAGSQQPAGKPRTLFRRTSQ